MGHNPKILDPNFFSHNLSHRWKILLINTQYSSFLPRWSHSRRVVGHSEFSSAYPFSVATPFLAPLKKSSSVCPSVEGRVPTVMWYARCSASTPGPAPTLTTHCTTGGGTFLSVVGFLSARCLVLCAVKGWKRCESNYRIHSLSLLFDSSLVAMENKFPISCNSTMSDLWSTL